MVYNCCVPTCPNKAKDVRLHRFPLLDVEAFEIWKERIAHPKFTTLTNEKIYQIFRVCRKHFNEVCLVKDCKFLAPRSLPTLNLPNFQESPDAVCRLSSYTKNLNLYSGEENLARIETVVNSQHKCSTGTKDICETQNNSAAEDFVDHLYSKSPKSQLNATDRNSISSGNVNTSNIPVLRKKYRSLFRKYHKLLREKKRSDSLKRYAICKLKNRITSDEIGFKNYERLLSAISPILTVNQTKVLFGENDVVWNPRELLMGFTIRYLGRKTYHFLRDKLNYPLPSLATIKLWISTLTKAQCRELMNMIDNIVTLDEVIEDDSLYFLSLAADDKPFDVSPKNERTSELHSVETEIEEANKKIDMDIIRNNIDKIVRCNNIDNVVKCKIKKDSDKIKQLTRQLESSIDTDRPICSQEQNITEIPVDNKNQKARQTVVNNVELKCPRKYCNIKSTISTINTDQTPSEIILNNVILKKREVPNLIRIVKTKPQKNTNQNLRKIGIDQKKSLNIKFKPSILVNNSRLKRPNTVQTKISTFDEISKISNETDIIKDKTNGCIQVRSVPSKIKEYQFPVK